MAQSLRIKIIIRQFNKTDIKEKYVPTMYEKQLIAQNKSHTQVPTHRNGGNKMEFMIMRDMRRVCSLSVQIIPRKNHVTICHWSRGWVYPGGVVFLNELYLGTPRWV